jgi:hypothetical protein
MAPGSDQRNRHQWRLAVHGYKPQQRPEVLPRHHALTIDNMKSKLADNILNRFTSLPLLLDILINNRLVFSDPTNWPDKNDTAMLESYKKAKPENAIFVLCFCIGRETIHHWTAFAAGISGCCIEFDRGELTKLLSAHKKSAVLCKKVVYKKRNHSVSTRASMIPFQKRDPYRIEKEFRAIWVGDKNANPFEIKIDVRKVIKRITLSPNMPNTLFETTKAFLHKHFKVMVTPSTLYRNSEWIAKFGNV